MNCAIAALVPYVPDVDNPWDLRRVTHLYRRAGFGTQIETLTEQLDSFPFQAVDAIVDAALALPPDPEPDFAFYDRDDFGALALLNSTLAKDGRAR